jgi:hypothetical protein
MHGNPINPQISMAGVPEPYGFWIGSPILVVINLRGQGAPGGGGETLKPNTPIPSKLVAANPANRYAGLGPAANCEMYSNS